MKSKKTKRTLIIVLCILIIANAVLAIANYVKVRQEEAENKNLRIHNKKLEDAKETLEEEEDNLSFANEKFKSDINEKNNSERQSGTRVTEIQTPDTENTDGEKPILDDSDKITKSVTVCIDAGHGITSKSGKEPVSPGSSEKKASNVSGAAGEEPVNLEISLKLRDALEARGIKTDMTRTTNECSKTNVERAEQANASSDYCIRIHCDGSENSSTNGISVLIPEKSYYDDADFVSDSKAMGQVILDSLISATGAKKIGLVTRGDLTGFNWSKIPVVLVECGFISNPEEKAKLQSEEYQTKVANAIADGFIKYIKGKE